MKPGSAMPTLESLRPPPSLQARLSSRIAAVAARHPIPPPTPGWTEPEWDEVTPGIWCKLLATDTERDRVSMLVRLGPGVAYPPHAHAGVEDLYLLEGELWIEDRKLVPGDCNHARAPSSDRRVWSEHGCTCVLVTSTKDVLT